MAVMWVGDVGVELVAQLFAQAIEAVVADHFSLDALEGVEIAGGTHDADDIAAAARALSSRSTMAVPRKPVAPVMAIVLPERLSEITHTVYHLVSD